MFRPHFSHKNKKFFVTPATFLGVVFYVIPVFVSAALGPLSKQGKTTDLLKDIFSVSQSSSVNVATRVKQREIQDEDYRSAWDEFGANVLVDSSLAPMEINKEIVRDIAQTVESELEYDRQEAAYLGATKTTPEEIQAIEGPANSDLPPGESINPHPSLELNPDVSISSVEGLDQSAPETTKQANETEKRNLQETGSETATTSTEVAPENVIFKAILQGEQTAPPAEAPTDAAPNTPASAETPTVE